MSYHNGSIWPHDNALIALGLARYGLKHCVEHVFKGLFDAATYMDLRRLPELFCGFRREKHRGPTLYPVACAPQAWASATPFTLLEASLGLEFDAERAEIRLRNPRLPAFLNEVVLRELQLGSSTIDLRIRRHGDDVSMEVLRRRGADPGVDRARALRRQLNGEKYHAQSHPGLHGRRLPAVAGRRRHARGKRAAADPSPAPAAKETTPTPAAKEATPLHLLP